MPSQMTQTLSARAAALLLASLCGVSACSLTKCADTSKGEAIFRERCGLCHSAGDDSGQGPGLGGILGRKAAAGKAFGYSRALRASGLTWDRPTLDRFLEDPSRLVPGTTMPIPVPEARDRSDLVAYLATLRAGSTKKAAPASSGSGDAVAAPGLRSGAAAFGDFRSDGPGVRRHLTVGDLPAAFATGSSRNAPSVVEAPAGARLHVPPGFRVEQLAKDLEGPRLLRVAPNGDVFVAESNAGRVRVLRAKDGVAAPEQVAIFAKDIDRPFGIAFYPPGPEPAFVYVAANNAVLRFPYRSGDLTARAPAETVVPRLSETTGGHWTRDVVFSPDGRRMFVSVGSASNVADGIATRTAAEIQSWEAAHGLGAAWGDEEKRADVLVFDAEGHGGHAFATGIRNCVGLAVHPATGDLWCSTNERDGLGDNLVPDYVTRVREGAFYGWPWYYLGDHEDPRRAGERRDLVGKITVPDVLLQPHSASLEVGFYDGAAFPAEFRGNAFAALHGSWNRKSRTGYKVIRVLVENGVPTGEYEDFLTGFVVDDDHVWGRPVGVAVAHDGALLVSEDGNGTIWRVSYAEPR
jgi:glucose/arabinose dehydrogenase/cytochrome c2